MITSDTPTVTVECDNCSRSETTEMYELATAFDHCFGIDDCEAIEAVGFTLDEDTGSCFCPDCKEKEENDLTFTRI